MMKLNMKKYFLLLLLYLYFCNAHIPLNIQSSENVRESTKFPNCYINISTIFEIPTWLWYCRPYHLKLIVTNFNITNLDNQQKNFSHSKPITNNEYCKIKLT